MSQRIRTIVARMLQPLENAIADLAVRGVVRLVKDAKNLQGVQVETFEDEPTEVLERFQDWGFTSVPLASDGVEAIVINLNGDPETSVVIAVVDRANRKTGLVPGESAQYDEQGQHVWIKRARVEIEGALIDLGAGAVKGVARLDDATVSDVGTDALFWAWLSGFAGVFAGWVVVPADGGAALKVAMAAYILANPIPSSLDGKVSAASTKVRAVD